MGAPGKMNNAANTTGTTAAAGTTTTGSTTKPSNALKKLFGRRNSGKNNRSNSNTRGRSRSSSRPRQQSNVTTTEPTKNSISKNTSGTTSGKASLSDGRQERKRGKRWGGVFKKNEATAGRTSSTNRNKEKSQDVVRVEEVNSSPVRIVVPPQKQNKQHQQTMTTKLTQKDFVPWQETLKEEDPSQMILRQKQLIKERDGFCRRVDTYDGQIIAVDGRPAYELGSYLGGGVAGVVYEGHRLRPVEEYPVRLGRGLGRNDNNIQDDNQSMVDSLMGGDDLPLSSPPGLIDVSFFDCGNDPATATLGDEKKQNEVGSNTYYGGRNGTVPPQNGAILTFDSLDETASMRRQRMCQDEAALEMTASNDQVVLIDDQDAPSRSSQYAKAVSMNHVESLHSYQDGGGFPSDASISYSLMEETVAIKVLNPVGFRTMDPESLQTTVVARKGDDLPVAVLSGDQPMEERHVWWLINPNSRNLRTLQRYPPEQKGPRRVQVDRGSAEKGLRISLIAAYRDKKGMLRELPLTRCIEIWGHVPFGASDEAFSSLLTAIDAINSGKTPPPMPAYWDLHNTQPIIGNVPGRIATASTANTTRDDASLESLPMTTRRT
jgi:hypothetical protein